MVAAGSYAPDPVEVEHRRRRHILPLQDIKRNYAIRNAYILIYFLLPSYTTKKVVEIIARCLRTESPSAAKNCTQVLALSRRLREYSNKIFMEGKPDYVSRDT
jgi:hypothetical protein